MNCCDEYGNCNQGRNCPVRVAKIGKKVHGPEPIRGAGWRHHLRRFAYWLLMAVLGLTVWPLLIYLVLRLS
jgi:hypothetical protein